MDGFADIVSFDYRDDDYDSSSGDGTVVVMMWLSRKWQFNDEKMR